MPVLSGFTISTLAMESHAHAFNTISKNVANVSTGGYKAADTQFKTILSQTQVSGLGGSTLAGATPVLDAAFGGVRPADRNLIEKQGNIVSSDGPLDVAISGGGFFVLNTQVDGSGETLFTRDGAFEVRNGADFSIAGIPLSDGTATSITTQQGFLVDKNGFFVQGRAVSADGTFSDTAAVASLRVDQFAFAEDFVATTDAVLVLNLPAGQTETLPQIDQFSLDGTVAAGDVISVTVNGNTVSVTATATDTLQNLRDNLVASINSAATVNSVVTAKASATNALDFNLEADELTVAFTSFSTVNSTSAIDVSSSTLQAAQDVENVFNISTVDSNGVKQTPRLDFAKIGNNLWEVRTTTSRTPVTQVDTVTITGDLENTDTYSITVNGNTISTTVTGLEAGINDVRSALINKINEDDVLNKVVTATGTGIAGEFTLTAVRSGTAFTATSSATDTGTKQVDTLTVTGAPGDNGDIYTVTVAGSTIAVPTDGTEASLNDIRNKIVTAINGDANASAAVVATNGGAGEIVLTAVTAGTPFTATTAITNVALGLSANGFTRVNTTPNGTIDTATLVNTTANVASSVTSSPTTLTFDGTGLLQSPSELDLDLTFEGGATSQVTLDISGLTQFDAALTPVSFEFGGFAKSAIENITINSDGVLSGTFSDDTNRPLFKIPLATFINANGLSTENGNTFKVSAESGDARLVNAGSGGAGILLPNSHELSNVDLGTEFTKIITTQKAYNAAATAFRTADEIIQTARDLKR